MSISLAQGIWISVFAIIAGIDFWLEGFYIFRPIIVCTVVGAILGNLKLGLVAGGLTELVFAGLTPVGGTQPPNPVMAGIMTVVLGLYYWSFTSNRYRLITAIFYSDPVHYPVLLFSIFRFCEEI